MNHFKIGITGVIIILIAFCVGMISLMAISPMFEKIDAFLGLSICVFCAGAALFGCFLVQLADWVERNEKNEKKKEFNDEKRMVKEDKSDS